MRPHRLKNGLPERTEIALMPAAIRVLPLFADGPPVHETIQVRPLPLPFSPYLFNVSGRQVHFALAR
jgi:hypothetical protein